jgi:hypothetical protein
MSQDGHDGRAGDLIPAFLSIDVEPDAFQVGRADGSAWAGFDAMYAFAETLRAELRQRLERPVAFGWYLRTDPQIAEIFGRADWLFSAYRDRLAALAAHGDYFGVHSHPIRWSAAHGCWVHDFGDAEWVAHSLRAALRAFARGAGEPARRYRCGAGFMTDEMCAVMDECGVQVELALEPVAGWGLSSAEVPTSVDGSPIVGAYTDCSGAPRTAYHPSRRDFRVRATAEARNVLMVPLSTATVRPSPESEPEVRVLYPSVPCPEGTSFWDLAAAEVDAMERPYLSIGVRTDAADMDLTARVRSVLAELPRHPLAARLAFVDPLGVAPALASH